MLDLHVNNFPLPHLHFEWQGPHVWEIFFKQLGKLFELILPGTCYVFMGVPSVIGMMQGDATCTSVSQCDWNDAGGATSTSVTQCDWNDAGGATPAQVSASVIGMMP
jgi:hypothetical protein